MPVAGQTENWEAQVGSEEPLLTGFEDADSPGAITAADFESNLGPVPDPLNVAPLDLDSPNATAINRNMSAFIDAPLHEDPNVYHVPQVPHLQYVEYNSSSTGTPVQNGAATMHSVISPMHHHHMAPVVHHFPPPVHHAMSTVYHASPPMHHMPAPVHHHESPHHHGSPHHSGTSHHSGSSHHSPPPLQNMVPAVLHPIEAHPGHYAPQYAMAPGMHTGPNVYTFEYCAPGVVHAPGLPTRRIDGGPQSHFADESHRAQEDATLQELEKTEEGRPQVLKNTGGVKKTRRVRGQKARLPNPSRFCHICLRRGERVKLKTCSNLADKSCRKVTCEKCFDEFKWDWAAACDPATKWTCTHCRKVCPERAQCFIYKRTNNRRHQALMEKKAREVSNGPSKKGEDKKDKKDKIVEEGMRLLQGMPSTPLDGEIAEMGAQQNSPTSAAASGLREAMATDDLGIVKHDGAPSCRPS